MAKSKIYGRNLRIAFLTKFIYDVIMNFTQQSFIVLFSIAIVMFFKTLFLSLVAPVLAILVAFYLMLSKRKRNENLNFFILTSLILILVTSTGEMSSPFFFLLYLLIFGIAFIFDPRVVFVFTIGLLTLFFPKALETDLTRNLILLFLFILLSPLAFFAGVAYQAKNQKLKIKMQNHNLKSKIKTHSKTFFLLLATCYLLLVTVPTAQGQTMSNKNYILKTEGLDTASNVATSEDKPQSTVGKKESVVSGGVNFKVKAGFENIAPNLPFSVSLSADLADFGNLTPTNPIVRTIDLSVYSLSTFGYSVVASENNPLTDDESSIPDTTCDDGACNEQSSGLWTNALSFGFGYRCDNLIGIDCERSFSNSNFYKSFANTSNSQNPQSVMAGIGSKSKSIRLSYKANISGTQGKGIYNNIITYIAIPNF